MATSGSSPPAIRVFDTTLVHPSSAGPALPEKSLPLTFYDIFWLHAPPVQRILFYRLPPDADVDAIIANLKASLSHAVRTFYPLAGRLRLTPGSATRYELHYRPGDAVSFTVAESDDDIDGLAVDEPREVARVEPLAPALPDGGAVLAVQATVLRRGGGLVVGTTVHHAACDGSGSTHFLRAWAAAAARAPPPPPPVIDRKLLADPLGFYDVVFCPDDANARAMGFVGKPEGLLLATCTLSRARLQRVKAAVAAEAAARGVAPPPRCTSLVAAMGFLWSCHHRAKARGGGGRGDRTYFVLAVDHRSRMKPKLPDKYFGNCMSGALAAASKAELEEAGAGGILAACTAIAAGIEEALNGIKTGSMEPTKERIMEAAAAGLLLVAGSPRFGVYELDMGFGRPAKVDMASVAENMGAAVADSRAGDGGMEVCLALPPEGMEKFQKCVADAVAVLDQYAGAP